jgi:hypothetical protein
VPSSGDPRLDELCRLAVSVSEAKGHKIGEWTEDGACARRATCGRCGRPLYARVGEGMTGMAGAALTQPCD